MKETLFELIIKFFKLTLERRVRIVLYVLQALFAVVFASELYKHYVGPYIILDLTDYQAIIGFVLSPQIFLPICFVAGVWYVFYELGYDFLTFLSQEGATFIIKKVLISFSKGPGQSLKDQYGQKISGTDKILEKFGAIQFTENSIGVKKKGEKYEKWLAYTEFLTKFSSDKRYLFHYLVLVLMFQFNIIYFFSLDHLLNSLLLDVIILIGLGLTLISFLLITFFIQAIVILGNKAKKSLEEAK